MFCKRPLSTEAARRARLFVGLRYAPASSKPGPAGEGLLPSWEGRHPSLILFPQAVSFCSRPNKINILVVDDDDGLRCDLGEALGREGYQVDVANNGAT